MTISLGTGTAATLVMLVAKATLLLLAALGVSALLQRASAGARHLVWVAIVGALLLLPAFVKWTPWRLAILPAATPSVAAQASGPAASPSVAPTAQTVPVPNAGSSAQPLASQIVERSNILATTSPLQLAAIIWGVIALSVTVWLALGFLNVRRIVRRARVLEDRLWTGPLYEIADRLGIDATPRLMRSEDVQMPFACGLVRPTIVLPAESDEWDIERRRAVLMHELAHIRRRDLLGHTLGRLACAVYWFHPLVWTAARRMRIESERACDDLALTCGLRATTYAEHLLDIVTAVGKTRTPAIAIPMAHRREFEGRMLAILDPALRRGVGRRQSAALLVGLVALVVVVGGAVPAPRTAAQLANDSAVPAPSISAPADTSANTTQVRVLTQNTHQSTAKNEVKQTLTSPSKQEREPAEIDRNPATEADRVSALTSAEVLKALQDTTRRDDRPSLLISVLRSDTSASLRRVAAWGLSRYAERSDVTDALAASLRRDSNSEVREMSAWALAHGAERANAVDALSEAVRRDADNEVKETALWALGNLDAEKAVDVLGDAISSQSKHLRMLAIWALGNSSPKSAPRALTNALNDPEKGVRMIAAWALFRIEDPESVPALEQALNREDDKDLRMGYIRALGAIGERSSAALARLIDSRDPQVRAVVVEALAGKGGGPWPWPWPNPRPNP
ncbi:MAG TPA: M56 family metallopeptidase [Gemmatimonadaceae bacterium]|nr:M56 family metallopeptidase [Gemmatimonadaceae bacterium]